MGRTTGTLVIFESTHLGDSCLARTSASGKAVRASANDAGGVLLKSAVGQVLCEAWWRSFLAARNSTRAAEI
jgi:hypothetical protein